VGEINSCLPFDFTGDDIYFFGTTKLLSLSFSPLLMNEKKLNSFAPSEDLVGDEPELPKKLRFGRGGISKLMLNGLFAGSIL